MKKILILLAVVASNIQAQQNSSTKLNVLFIGNSLTYYNDMPQILQEMLLETHPHINVEQSTFPGMSLNSHLNMIVTSNTENSVSTRQKQDGELTATEKKICERKWDVIVLQTGGVGVLIPEARKLQINTSIEKIKGMVDTADTRLILFTTWTTKEEYPKEYCYFGRMIDASLGFDKKYCSQKITEINQEEKLLKDGYCSIAEETGIEITNHGEIFNNLRQDNPSLGLLEDTMHPSPTGAFLNAGIFYQILTNGKVTELKYKANLGDDVATTIKIFADKNHK